MYNMRQAIATSPLLTACTPTRLPAGQPRRLRPAAAACCGACCCGLLEEHPHTSCPSAVL